MLPAAARMRRRAEFTATMRGGRRVAGPALVVHYRTSPGSDRRVGFIVSRALGTAVARNRLRRRLRHLVRERLDTLPIGCALVVRANPAAAAMSSRELAGHLDRSLSRLTAGRVG